MKKLFVCVGLVCLGSLLGIVGSSYFHPHQRMHAEMPSSTKTVTNIDMDKYRKQVDEMVKKLPDKEEGITEETRENLAKELALPDQLYKTIPLSVNEPGWTLLSSDPEVDTLQKQAEKYLSGDWDPFEYAAFEYPYSMSEIRNLFEALWNGQGVLLVERATEECRVFAGKEICYTGKPRQENLARSFVQHTHCVAGTDENCKGGYFSYSENLLPVFLRRQYEDNTQSVGYFCFRNFGQENCEQGYVFSQRMGRYQKTTFCDSFKDGACQGTYVLEEKTPACHCGPSVKKLEIKQENGNWQYTYTDYTPHKVMHTTLCTNYDMEAHVCLLGEYKQEETEGEADENSHELAESVHLIKGGKLSDGVKFLTDPKPYLNLKDIIQ